MTIHIRYKIPIGLLRINGSHHQHGCHSFHERKRVCEIESEVTTIHQVRRDISAVHHQITILASYGESVIGWDEEDSPKYRERRLKGGLSVGTDERNCIAFVNPMQLDTLRFIEK